MTLPSSGALAFSQIQSEFGGSNPISLSEYYRGGPIVPNHGNTSNIPTSGSISVSNFYGTSAQAPFPNVRNANIVSGVSGNLKGFVAGNVGSFSPNPLGTLSSGYNFNVNQISTQLVGCTNFLEFRVNGTLPNAGWTNITIQQQQAGTYNQARANMSYSTSGGQTLWQNVKWIFNFANSGNQSFQINA